MLKHSRRQNTQTDSSSQSALAGSQSLRRASSTLDAAGAARGTNFVNSRAAFGQLTDTVNQVLEPMVQRQRERIASEEQGRAAEESFERANVRLEIQGSDGNFTYRDVEGVVMPKTPDPMIPTLRSEAYRAAVESRYSAELKRTGMATVTQLRAEFQNDPDGYAAAVDAYIKASVEAAPDEYKGLVDSKLRPIGDQMVMGAIQDRVQNDMQAAAEANFQDQNEAFEEIMRGAVATQGMPVQATNGSIAMEPGMRQSLNDFEAGLAGALEMGTMNPTDVEKSVYNLQHGYIQTTLMAQLEAMPDNPAGQAQQLKVLENLRSQSMLVPERGENGEWELREVKVGQFLKESDVAKLQSAGRSTMAARGAYYRAKEAAATHAFQARMAARVSAWTADPSKAPSTQQILAEAERVPAHRRASFISSMMRGVESASKVALSTALTPIREALASGAPITAELRDQVRAGLPEDAPPEVWLQLNEQLGSALRTEQARDALDVEMFGRSLWDQSAADARGLAVWLNFTRQNPDDLGIERGEWVDKGTEAIDELKAEYANQAKAAMAAGNTALALRYQEAGTKAVAAAQADMAAALIGGDLSQEELVAMKAELAEHFNLGGSAAVDAHVTATDEALARAALSADDPDPITALMSEEAAVHTEALNAGIDTAKGLEGPQTQQRLKLLQDALNGGQIPSGARASVESIIEGHRAGDALTTTNARIDAFVKTTGVRLEATRKHLANVAAYKRAAETTERTGTWIPSKTNSKTANAIMAGAVPGGDPTDPSAYASLSDFPDGIVAMPTATAQALETARASGDPELVASVTQFVRGAFSNPKRMASITAVMGNDEVDWWKKVLSAPGNQSDPAIVQKAMEGAEVDVDASLGRHDPQMLDRAIAQITERAAERFPDMDEDALNRYPAWGEHVRNQLAMLTPTQLQHGIEKGDWDWGSLSTKYRTVEEIVGGFEGKGHGATRVMLDPQAMDLSGRSPQDLGDEAKGGAFDKFLALGQTTALFKSLLRGETLEDIAGVRAGGDPWYVALSPERLTNQTAHQLQRTMTSLLKASGDRAGPVLHDPKAPGKVTPAATADLILGVNMMFVPEGGVQPNGHVSYGVVHQDTNGKWQRLMTPDLKPWSVTTEQLSAEIPRQNETARELVNVETKARALRERARRHQERRQRSYAAYRAHWESLKE